MSENHPEPELNDDSADEFARYAAFDTESGSIVIYDEENNRAWIQSDAAVALDANT